jgi:hypothetical protein
VPEARLDMADPTLANVTMQVLLNENGSTPVMYGVRLKVVNHEITEIEGLKPEPIFLQELAKLQDLYLDYLEGKKSGRDVPCDMMTAAGRSVMNCIHCVMLYAPTLWNTKRSPVASGGSFTASRSTSMFMHSGPYNTVDSAVPRNSCAGATEWSNTKPESLMAKSSRRLFDTVSSETHRQIVRRE